MAYCAIVRNRLANANFMGDYADHVDTWRELAAATVHYVMIYEGEPRPDDVAPHLALALETHDLFREALSRRRLSARHWFRDFADLILDKLWSQLVGGQQQ